jgi:hypothetical protein
MSLQTLSRTQVDLSGLLTLLADSLYSTPEVVLRELVQNGHDSCVRRRLEDPAPFEAKVRITTDPALCARFVERGKAPTSVILISPREVYMQCAKSILRSRLWGDAPRPAGVPTAGQMIASHTGGMMDSAAYDATAPARLAETLY